MGDEYQGLAHVPRLGVLQSRIRAATPALERLKVERNLEQLSYTLQSTARALTSLIEAQREVVARYGTHERKPMTIHVYQLEDVDWHNMAFEVDRFLEAARRTQNSLSFYLSKVLRLSVPNSLADVVKNIESGKLSLPNDISEVITKYWKNDGRKLKAYRDLSQHHAVVSSDGRVTFPPNNAGLVFLVLPVNPEEGSPARLLYQPRIHAFEYMADSYRKLLALACMIVRLLLPHTKETELLSLVGEFRGGLVPGKPEGNHAPDVADILADCEAIRRHYE